MPIPIVVGEQGTTRDALSRATPANPLCCSRVCWICEPAAIIDHSGGDYSIYGSLSRAAVRPQQTVTKGQQIGEVGISDPDIAPHLHFEIRHGTDGRPVAIDPAKWLKDQR